jgi:hypothetical protein
MVEEEVSKQGFLCCPPLATTIHSHQQPVKDIRVKEEEAVSRRRGSAVSKNMME